MYNVFIFPIDLIFLKCLYSYIVPVVLQKGNMYFSVIFFIDSFRFGILPGYLLCEPN